MKIQSIHMQVDFHKTLEFLLPYTKVKIFSRKTPNRSFSHLLYTDTVIQPLIPIVTVAYGVRVTLIQA